MKLCKLFATTALLAACAGGALATPSAVFRVDGDTFSPGSFSLWNQSDNLERITRIVFDLSGFGLVFDTVQGGPPGNNTDARDFDPNATQAAEVGLVGPVSIVDGSTLLDISFTSFGADTDGNPSTPPGLFSWGIDVDSSNGAIVTVTGNQLAGIGATIWFSDNSSLRGVLSNQSSAGCTVGAFSSCFSVSGGTAPPPPPPPPTGLPEPGSLALSGLALLALGALSRKRQA